MRLLRFLLIAGVAAVPVTAYADQAPFGLHWGDTLDSLRDRGVTLEGERSNGELTLFRVNGLRTEPADTSALRVVISKKLGLERVIWLSKDIDDNAFGKKGIQAYRDRQAKMSEDFGDPSEHSEESGVVQYTRPDQFYQCLATDGCGDYVTRWRTEDGDVYLRLIANRTADRGALQAIYDGPEWDQLNGKRR